MAKMESVPESARIAANGATGKTDAPPIPPTPESWLELCQTVEALRAENALLRHNLLMRLFPPETAPRFDPSEFQLTTWDEIESSLRAVEQE